MIFKNILLALKLKGLKIKVGLFKILGLQVTHVKIMYINKNSSHAKKIIQLIFPNIINLSLIKDHVTKKIPL